MLTKKMKLFTNVFKICALIGEHLSRYAHAIRFVVGLHGTQNFYASHKIELLQKKTLVIMFSKSPVASSY